MKPIESVAQVVSGRLCIGCGACAYVCPESKISLWDFPNEGIRPVLSDDDCGACRQCVDVCPAVVTDFGGIAKQNSGTSDALGDQRFREDWGIVLEAWEGYATDPEIRFKGSSGGVLTALAAYCLEIEKMHGVLHVAQNPNDPVRNRTCLSRTREELIAATGSRYSPASVCQRLDSVEQAPAQCVIIGKPSEIAAVRKAQSMKPELDAKIGIALSFFCAESPSTAGTVSLLEKMGLSPDEISDLRYRGNGWPGYFAPIRSGASQADEKIPYRETWRFLQAYRPWSVHLWPDGTGELADISCGDPWYELPDGKNPGFSIVAVRSERGRAILRGAIQAGYLTLEKVEPWKLVKSQQSLANKKAATWGRLVAMRLMRLRVPTFLGANLFRCWLRLPFKGKIKSVAGTLRRIIVRKLYRPLKLDRNTAVLLKGTQSLGSSLDREHATVGREQN